MEWVHVFLKTDIFCRYITSAALVNYGIDGNEQRLAVCSELGLSGVFCRNHCSLCSAAAHDLAEQHLTADMTLMQTGSSIIGSLF